MCAASNNSVKNPKLYDQFDKFLDIERKKNEKRDETQNFKIQDLKE